MLNSIIRFFLENKLVAYLLLLLFVTWGFGGLHLLILGSKTYLETLLRLMRSRILVKTNRSFLQNGWGGLHKMLRIRFPIL